MDTIWSKQDLADAERKEVKIVYENLINPDRMEQRELPSDLHIVTYEIDGDTRIDAVRAYKMVDIFDVYYDKLKTNILEVIDLSCLVTDQSSPSCGMERYLHSDEVYSKILFLISFVVSFMNLQQVTMGSLPLSKGRSTTTC